MKIPACLNIYPLRASTGRVQEAGSPHIPCSAQGFQSVSNVSIGTLRASRLTGASQNPDNLGVSGESPASKSLCDFANRKAFLIWANVAGYASHSRNCRQEDKESRQGCSQLHMELEASLGCTESCLAHGLLTPWKTCLSF